MSTGPLSGYKVIELAGIGPGPYAGQLLADMGADVINIERPVSDSLPFDNTKTIDKRGKRNLTLDLRKDGAAEIVLRLVKDADILIEGNRPGVTERLGVGPEDCHAVNPKLVYGRMTGWGQDGPWSQMAGHDINYISITGALNAMGPRNAPPPTPLNMVGDYGGGSMFLVTGILAALLKAEKTGKGDIVDAAIVDGVSSMMGIVYSLEAMGMWQNRREANLLDGATPYYRCYETSDGLYMAAGPIEAQFFAIMLEKLEIDPAEFGGQNDFSKWPAQHKMLEATFKSKTRAEWAEIFEGTDACVTPVLDYVEALSHPQNVARGGLKRTNGRVHPRTAPAFAGRAEPEFTIAPSGFHTREVLTEAGYSDPEIDGLIDGGLVKSARE